MKQLSYRRGVLNVEAVPLSAIAAAQGTPAYVYSTAALKDAYFAFEKALTPVPHLICYSVKASSNLAILSLFAKWGSGFDIVSRGELLRVKRAGGDPSRLVFAGVGKTADEMAEALAAGIRLFNVESAEELDALDAVGRAQGRQAPFAIRVNPDVDAKTHRHIATGLETSKFGVPLSEAAALYERSRKLRGVRALGVDCHIGSQMTSLKPVREAVRRVGDFYLTQRERGHPLQYLDLGGGLGITYSGERPPSAAEYAGVLVGAAQRTGATLLLEPGRSLVGNAGILLTQVLYRKRTPARRFVIVDAGMNDLIRPALYEAHHEIWPVAKPRGRARLETVEVVGPVCESTDVLARGRRMVMPEVGSLQAFLSAGAYGMSMASSYNSRPRPVELLVDGSAYRVIRARETLEDLWRGEQV